MKTCKACKNQIGDAFARCPICKMVQENADPGLALYPKGRRRNGRFLWRKITSLCLWGGVAVSAIVNLFVGGMPWAVLVFLGAYTLQTAVLSLETAEVSFIRRIISGSFAVSALLWGIAYITQSGVWATAYAIPLVLLGGMIASVSLFCSAFRHYRTQFLPILVLIVGALVAAGFGLRGQLPMAWPLIALAGFSLVVLLTVVILHHKVLRAEWKKKMHR